MPRWSTTVPAVLLALTSACAVGPNYTRPPLSVPEVGRGAPGEPAAESIADRAWWEICHDDALRSLVDEAIRGGYDLRIAAARVEEARALAGIARSEFYPGIDATLG